MPLRSSIIYLLLSLIFVYGSLDARSAVWKPERMPGSAQLALDEIRSIFVPSDPSDALSAGVEDVVALWPGDLSRGESGAIPSKNSLVLIRDPAFALRGYGVACLDDRNDGGFSIRRERTKVYLSASSDEGLTNGLYAICRELLGARWYWSGELGFEQVGEVAEKMPERPWRERPAFEQRTISKVGDDFTRRNGINRTYSFIHNLARIFTQDVYETSPEAFAEISGERRRPSGSKKYDPQPDFTERRAVELAADAARAHFIKEPGANSFSLSINDNSLFDEGLETQAIITPISYFRGRPNYTDLVFGFMNRVAERLDKKAEGGDLKPEGNSCWSQVSHLRRGFGGQAGLKSQPSAPYLTALAYYWTEQSPSFKVHPRVMPVLTSDRAQWHDPDYRAEDKALIKRWANSGAERIATWDYYFGAPYPYSRQFTRWIDESIKYLNDTGVDVFFSQLHAIWGLDGPKAWLTAELLRDPEQDVAVLLDEFYTNFFGPAAEPIREFYEIAERTRNEREGTANWIKFYKDEAGIELFDEASLNRMRECLDAAERNVSPSHSRKWASVLREPQGLESVEMASGAPTEPGRFVERVKIVSEAFSYTESYADYHRSRVGLVELAMGALNGEANTAGEVDLAQALADYKSRKASFEDISRRLAKEPMHSGFSAFNRLLQSDPTALAWAALAHLNSDLHDVAGGKSVPLLSMVNAWRKGEARLVSVGKNSGLKHQGKELRNFLGPEMPVIENWEIQYRASEGLRIEAIEGAQSEGIRIENADIVSLSQTCPVLGEKSYLLQIDASWQVSPDNRTWVQLNWESIAGEKLRTDILLRLPNGTSAGTQILGFALQAPVNAYDLKLSIVTNRQYEGDYLEIQRVELGELVLKR